MEILEIVVRGDVKLLKELVLQVEITPEILCPAKWPPKFKHEVGEVTDLDEGSTL